MATIVCVTLLGARALTLRPRSRVAWLMALIAFDTTCNVILGRADRAFWIDPAFRIDVGAWGPFLNLARNLTPAAFMLLCHTLYAEKRRFPRWLLALAGLQLFLEEPAHWFIPADWPGANALTEIAPTLLQTVFASMALYWTIATWRGDLVERRRRRLRPITVVVIGFNMIVSGLLTRLVIDPNAVESYYVHVALIASHAALAAFVLLQIAGADLDVAAPVRATAPAPAAPNADDAALLRLTALMNSEHVHRDPGLTLKALADRVGLPEYRLRKLIHERLGFANFNAFLHSHRIADAAHQLRDPAMARVPILTIALSVGYQSVNTFNRGFREVMGVTPSAYRAGAEKDAPTAE